MKKIMEVLKRIVRNPATKAVVVGLVLFAIENPALLDITINNPIVAILTIVVVGMGLYIDPKTPGVSDDQRTFVKEILDIFKLILKSKQDEVETPEESNEEEVPTFEVEVGE